MNVKKMVLFVRLERCQKNLDLEDKGDFMELNWGNVLYFMSVVLRIERQ